MNHSLKTIAIAASLAAGAFTAHAQATDPASPPGIRATQPGVPAIDRDFINAAAHGGHAEIQAAQLALSRPVGPDVKDFAQRLVDEHTAANGRLLAIAARKQVSVPGEPSLAQQGRLQVLRAKSGEDFMTSFVQMFGVQAHRDSIAQFRDQVRRGQDQALVQFARSTLPALQEHLRRAEQLEATLSARAGSGRPGTAATAASRNAQLDADTERVAQQQIDDAVRAVQRMKADPRVTAVLERARGVFILPSYGRGALGIGVQGGEGLLVTRAGENFSNPVFYNLAGISVGAQAGGAGGPVAMLLMTDRAVREFTSGKNFSLNADAGLTVVDFSRRAQVSGGKVQDIVVWSGAKGAYAGASVAVTGVTFDDEDNAAYYGRGGLNPRSILQGQVGGDRNNVLGMVLGA